MNVASGLSVQRLADHPFPFDLRCPRCGSRRVIGWGCVRGRPRYRCRRCRRTFTAFTGTPLAGLHYPDRWPALAQCLLQGLSVRATARRLGIHPSTAFRWRHRALLALAAHADARPRLKGIVEVAELALAHSDKGRRDLSRPARRRGVRYTAPWSVPRVYAVIARDRRARVSAVVTGLGAPRVEELEAVLVPHIARGSVLCPPRPGAYRALCRRARLVDGYVGFRDRQRRVRGRLWHNANAADLRRRLREWLRRFRGVATRYLQRYLAWYTCLEQLPDARFCQPAEHLLHVILLNP